jgi:carboxymethylenebutenolidase
MTKVEITTEDGVCPAYVFEPEGAGPWPGVLVFMDGVGIRPAMLALGERLASNGYFVLLPDVFYRSGPYPQLTGHDLIGLPGGMRAQRAPFFALATVANVMRDTKHFIAWLHAQSQVRKGAIATTGYCFGGLMSLSAAGNFPDDIALAASFHGGRLASDQPDSPHLLAPRMKARIYVAGAIEDPSFPDDMKARLEDALTKANVKHTVTTYQAKHGWVFDDVPVHDAAAADQHWAALLSELAAVFPSSK